jgi:hypothetical protein
VCDGADDCLKGEDENKVLFFDFNVADPDPGSGMGKKSGSGSRMNNPDHISERLETIFVLLNTYLNFVMRIRDLG